MRLILSLCSILVVACTAPETALVQSETDPLVQLETLLEGKHQLCETDKECASEVCDLGNCIGLVDVVNGSMERRIATKLDALIQAHPSVAQSMHTRFIPDILKREVTVRIRLAGVLGRLKHEPFIPTLEQLARSDIELEAVKATLALGWMAADTHYESVKDLLKHRSKAVALAATEGIIAYTRHASNQADATNTLKGLLDHPDHRIRRRAIEGFRTHPVKDSAVRIALEDISKSSGDEFLRYDAIQALKSMDGLTD